MPTTYENLLRSALSNATRGMTPDKVALIVDGLSVADTLFPLVSQAVCEAAAANEYRRSLVTRQKSITLVAGTATLGTDVLTHYITDAILLDPANLSKHYAYRQYPDFIRRGDRRLGIFTVRGQHELQVIDPNVGFTVPLVTSGTRTLTVASVIEKPATASTNIDAPDEIVSDLDSALAEVLRGELIINAAVTA